MFRVAQATMPRMERNFWILWIAAIWAVAIPLIPLLRSEYLF